MKRVPRLKFCGLTREVDVESAIESGACAIGLNFVATSKRFIDRRVASHLSHIAAGRILRVGVFVNTEPHQVAALLRICSLDAIQLHGDEGIDWVDRAQSYPELAELPILRALPYRGGEDDPAVERWGREAKDPRSPVAAILVDAYDPIERGGTGKIVRWDLLDPRPASFFAAKPSQPVIAEKIIDEKRSAPLILAGGIDRYNVSEACERAKPEGIDVASGIEIAPGIKDREAMFSIAEQVHSYFAHLRAENA
jgi:phosphoribosylanthranilate isomerase